MTLTPAYPASLDAHERAIIDRVILDALALGCTIGVFDGEEWPVKRSTDYTAITAEIAATDETSLRIVQANISGTILFVHGNAASEVIADHTDSPWMRSIIAGAERIADDLAERGL